MNWLTSALNVDTTQELWWLAFGFLAQMLFMARFVLQWIASERARDSVVPVAFFSSNWHALF